MSKIESKTLPVIEERVVIGKRRTVTGRVRVSKRSIEKQHSIDLPVIHEHIDVQRVPINREVDVPAQMRREGDVLIVPVRKVTADPA